jgi:hypothetical protein
MADYTFAIEDKEAATGSPKYLLVDLQDPLSGPKIWTIGTANDWIGTGVGEFRIDGGTLELRDGAWDEGVVRFTLFDIIYPQDLQRIPGGVLKRGAGMYESSGRQMSGAQLEWSGRNIVPDEF